MKRAIAVLVACCMLITLAGCSPEWKKKFTRKPKTTAKKMPRIYQVKKYDVKPSIELYKKHYVYWKTWQDELVEVIGENTKKDKRCIEEIIGQLGDMQNILVDEKAEKMEPHIAEMRKVADTIEEGALSPTTRDYLRRKLEREERSIKRDFGPNKVKAYIRESFDDGMPSPVNVVVTSDTGKEAQVEAEK